MFRALVFLSILTVLQSQLRNDPLMTLTAYEQKQRLSAQLDNKDYNLIPFRLANISQTFILAPITDQTLSVEIVVHWITSDSTLMLPLFDLSQKVRLTIEEDNYGGSIQKPLIVKEFLTQTGFKVRLFAGKKYRCRMETAGKISKLVEIATTSRQQTVNSLPSITKNHTNEMKVLEEMRNNLEKAQMRWAERSHHSERDEEVESIWEWMSGIEMISLLAFVGMQIFLFERFSFASSII